MIDKERCSYCRHFEHPALEDGGPDDWCIDCGWEIGITDIDALHEGRGKYDDEKKYAVHLMADDSMQDALKRIALHCSKFVVPRNRERREGGYWCDFCGSCVLGSTQSDKGKMALIHESYCPIKHIVDLLIL